MAVHYDLVIIGAGPGGYTAAEHAARLGMRTALIEKGSIGGVCVNDGAMPAKAMLQAATMFRDIRRASHFGLTVGQAGFSLGNIQEYKNRIVTELRSKIILRLQDAGADLVHGEAKLHRNNDVEIRTAAGTEYVHGDRIILATGSRPVIPDIPGIDLPQVTQSIPVLRNPEWHYDTMVVIGGGVIGVEMATVFASLGSEVTILERSTRLLPGMDRMLSAQLGESLADLGIRVVCGASVTGIEEQIPGRSDGPALVTYKLKGRWEHVSADTVLTAVGRKPDMSGVLAEDCEVTLDKSGKPVISRSMMTTQENVYAIGDTVSPFRLAHMAASQAIYVVEHIAKVAHRMQLTVVPSGMYVVLPVVPICIYSEPEIASVGFTEAEAATYNMKVKIGCSMMRDNGRATLSDRQRGFVRLLFEAYSNTLVGAQIMCARASDMIGEMATAISNGLTAYQLSMAMRAHPTYSEAITAAIEDALRSDRKK